MGLFVQPTYIRKDRARLSIPLSIYPSINTHAIYISNYRLAITATFITCHSSFTASLSRYFHYPCSVMNPAMQSESNEASGPPPGGEGSHTSTLLSCHKHGLPSPPFLSQSGGPRRAVGAAHLARETRWSDS